MLKRFCYFYSMTPERKARLFSVVCQRQTGITVVLENVFDPHNISAVLRTCDAVGVQEVYVLNTRIPKHKKWGAKSSSSAAKWLTIHQFSDVESCFKELRNKYSRILTTHLSSEAVNLYDIDFTEPVALVFGNEHSGVSDDIRFLGDGNFAIPQTGVIRSLNISVACAVTLYEAYRQKSLAGHYKHSVPESPLQKKLLDDWGIGDTEHQNHKISNPR